MKVEKVRYWSLGFPESTLKSQLKVSLFFLRIGNDLVTYMGANRILSETLKRFYTLVYWEGQESWDFEYLCFKKRPWGIQARKVIIKEGLDWWFLDRMSRSDIFTTRF